MLKPLDLEEIKKKIFEHFCEELFGTKKPRDITEWSDIGKIGGEHGIDAEEIEELVEFTINETLQRIKSTVQGLLGEIDELIEWYEKNRKEDYHIFTAKRDTAFRIKTKIKKWFPDVVKEEEV